MQQTVRNEGRPAASGGRRVGTIEEIWQECSSSRGWSHSGIVVLRDGTLVFAHPGGRRLVFHHPRTGSTAMHDTGLLEMHGIALDRGCEDRLWLADPGVRPDPEKGYEPDAGHGRVVRWEPGLGCTLEVAQPLAPAYARSGWRPTSVSVDSTGFIWVADGYGASLVHRFTPAGEHVLTLDGSESRTVFDCPHGILVCATTEGGEDEVHVADRGNRRIVVYGEDGGLRRVLTSPELTSPSCLAVRDGVIFLTELFGGIVRVDAGHTVSAIIPAPRHQPEPPWPNRLRDGLLVRPELDPTRLHSPHGIAVGPDGALYTTEWCIGGRQLRITLE